MEPTRCEWCGADPAVGYAFLYDSAGTRRYCHPDEGVSCYEAAQLGVTCPQSAEMAPPSSTRGGRGAGRGG